MLPSQNCSILIQSFEGLGGNEHGEYVPYICPAGIYTVGWGHALTTPTGQNVDAKLFGGVKAKALAQDAMQRLYGKQILSKAEVDALLSRDLAAASSGVSKLLAANTTQSQFDALVSFSYNVGIGNFRSSSLLKLHNAGQRHAEFDLEELAQAAKLKAEPVTIPIAFARWSNINGEYSLGLFRRRACEAMVYDGGNAATAFKTAEAFAG